MTPQSPDYLALTDHSVTGVFYTISTESILTKYNQDMLILKVKNVLFSGK